MFATIDGNSILDLRPFTSSAQVDTYRVGFAAGDAYPLTFSWPNMSSYYSGAVRLKYDISGSEFDVNMKAQNSYKMKRGPTGAFGVVNIYLIAEGRLTSPPVSLCG